MNKARLVLALTIIALIGAIFWLDFDQYLTLEFFRGQHESIESYVDNNLTIAVAIYFLIYVSVTALNIPGAAVMTLVAGAIFGILVGVIVVSFASTLGATLAFLLSRFLLRDYIENRFRQVVVRLNAGIDKEGAYYLFTLRLVPIFPFFVIN